MASNKALVVGAGAVGLRTALELLRRNYKVVVQAPVSPLHSLTCSFGSGGKWGPVHCQDSRVDRWALETLHELWPLGQEQDSDLVEIVPAVYLLKDHGGPSVEDFAQKGTVSPKESYSQLPVWAQDPLLEFQHMSIEMLAWQNINFQLRLPPLLELQEAGYDFAWMFKTPIVDPPKMLRHYLHEISIHENTESVNVDTGLYFESIEHMVEHAKSLGCNAVVNCTGLGASDVCNDDELSAGRGVTLHFDRRQAQRRLAVLEGPYGNHGFDAVIATEDPPWAPSKSFPCYLIPRGNILVVGGSFLVGDAERGIRDSEREHLLKTAERFGIDVQASPPIGEWTGFRPWRPTLRCEVDSKYTTRDFKVAHNYGHGGSGWTINAGTAKECVNLLVGHKQI